MTTKEIRQAYLDFFKEREHQIVLSAPIVIKNDPTLMFTNAGMNQFKELFLGETAVKYSRIANTQRCLRVSGKHNDLEEVGIDTYHHTMFEMLGNWSFGNYFKKEAILWSWELLTEVYKIPKDQLYVTVFEGDEKEGLPKDQETYDLWKGLIAEDRILSGNKKDNFWEMGETGPCGPCSEIHVDMRPEAERLIVKGDRLVNKDHPQVIEIWNNVFMQFNRLRDGSLQTLPAQHVDTGMGLERLVRVLQKKSSNYDTDVFQPLIQFISKEANIPYGQNEQTDIAMRVMADHIRAISFCIADGQLPSSNKAGYVVRRILRRAVRYAYTFLNIKEPFLNKLVPILADQFNGIFPELEDQQDYVQKVILEEEVSFLRTLIIGLERFDNFINSPGKLKKSSTSIELDKSFDDSWQYQEDQELKLIPGKLAFELSDTYGFPIDLTELLAREKGFKVDMAGFNQALDQQKIRSRAATAIDTGDWIKVNEGEETEFTGYDELETECRILRYRQVNLKGKELFQVILDRTPFYAEGGGQTGDTGRLEDHSRLFQFEVTDTKKENGLIIHYLDLLPADLEGNFFAVVDEDKRLSTQNNHSATHLLHAALRQVLGAHVNQKGSLVNERHLRFDFSHFNKINSVDLEKIERIVNQKIRENITKKEERNVSYQEALQSGVTALFGEKYGDYVRVITFGDHFSKELCGGTHVNATGELGFFKIISESAVAAGVRRIEAITGEKAENYISKQLQSFASLNEIFNNPADINKSVKNLLEENNLLKKEVERYINEKASGLKQELIKTMEEINGVNFIAQKVTLPNSDALKNLAYEIKKLVPNLFLVLGSEIEGKPEITVMLSENLVNEKGLNAGAIVRVLAKEIQGGGGGQSHYATAGGKDLSGLDAAIRKAKSYLSI
ncbi:MAG: alanine--tRNA ligase [Flavobacterium sp.]|nr:alanine--tRNA ligase [Pedobacter sp.]